CHLAFLNLFTSLRNEQDLGPIYTNKLALSPHADRISAKATQICGFISHNFFLLEIKVFTLRLFSRVGSFISYTERCQLANIKFLRVRRLKGGLCFPFCVNSSQNLSRINNLTVLLVFEAVPLVLHWPLYIFAVSSAESIFAAVCCLFNHHCQLFTPLMHSFVFTTLTIVSTVSVDDRSGFCCFRLLVGGLCTQLS
ncbi:unnamed protein product, partial [Schistocephalus solidus]|uniref:Secreted protein n=1 Tax=Schistocephalus solidus TaxID=70667 RepID=A0A183S8V8_SCHSO